MDEERRLRSCDILHYYATKQYRVPFFKSIEAAIEDCELSIVVVNTSTYYISAIVVDFSSIFDN